MSSILEQDVRLAKNGDKEALDAIICGIKDNIYGLAMRMLRHPEDAEDQTQEILIKVITHLSDFREESAFSTWVYQIACNHLLRSIPGSPFARQKVLEELYGGELWFS